MRELCHYTITTGHVRQSSRAEVGDDVVTALQPLLRPGEHAMPAPPGGYRVRVTVDGMTLAATVVTDAGVPLVTSLVCLDQAGLDAVLRVTGAIAAVPLPLPCVLDELHPTLALDPGAAGWTGDWSRCLGWAWVEAHRSQTRA